MSLEVLRTIKEVVEEAPLEHLEIINNQNCS